VHTRFDAHNGSYTISSPDVSSKSKASVAKLVARLSLTGDINLLAGNPLWRPQRIPLQTELNSETVNLHLHLEKNKEPHINLYVNPVPNTSKSTFKIYFFSLCNTVIAEHGQTSIFVCDLPLNRVCIYHNRRTVYDERTPHLKPTGIIFHTHGGLTFQFHWKRVEFKAISFPSVPVNPPTV
jgi:hypothetical protein